MLAEKLHLSHGKDQSELPGCLSAPKLLWSSLGHSLPTPNILLVPACWIVPPRHTNTSDLGSVAGIQISSGSAVSAAVKLDVVFGLRQV